jgi:hypothetical protein
VAKISKKQRAALREIDKLAKEYKRDQLIGFGSIAVMAVFIVVYNALAYQMGVLDDSNVAVRAMLYLTAMVLAGLSGIKLMHASRKKSKMDGYRQANGISRETLDAWNNGEIEK